MHKKSNYLLKTRNWPKLIKTMKMLGQQKNKAQSKLKLTRKITKLLARTNNKWLVDNVKKVEIHHLTSHIKIKLK